MVRYLEACTCRLDSEPRSNMSARPRIWLVVGARPNLIKMAPIVAAIQRTGGLDARLIHTGQHYDQAMSDVFFKELGLPPPDVNLGVGSGSHAEQTSAVMLRMERLLTTDRPALITTVGDVNSTLAAALVAVKAQVPQAHVEAGLRSHDPAMPEEVNRVLVDRVADLLFTHSDDATENLRHEGVEESRIHMVGNVMIDTLLRLRSQWQGAAVSALPGLTRGNYGVVTLHRPENVDGEAALASLLWTLGEIAAQVPLVFPVHPRTRSRLPSRPVRGLNFVEPLGYMAFMDLVEHAKVVLTDSGGIQEETTVLGVPCLTLRNSTERPVTVRLGTNSVVGTDPVQIKAAVSRVLTESPRPWVFPPLWDGQTAGRITNVIEEYLKTGRPLRLSG
jgi:UDP-N-acetylglucosamine 2-epimerase (non-hydrolysing)